jgi:hypothetical protein
MVVLVAAVKVAVTLQQQEWAVLEQELFKGITAVTVNMDRAQLGRVAVAVRVL